MGVSGFMHRLLVGEHRCRLIVEVPDLGAEGWRRLTADPELSWRRVTPPRRPGAQPGVLSLPRRRRAGAKVEPLLKLDAPVPALLEVRGTASGTASVAKQRLAGRALVALRAAGLHGELVGAAEAEPATEVPTGQEVVWPASDGVLIFGPAEQDELDRRFALASSVWTLDGERARGPEVPAPGQRRGRALVDLLAGGCVLPLLLMVVPTVGPWLDRRSWALWLAAAAICVVVPILLVQALSARWPVLAAVRGRALLGAAAMLALLLVARVLVAVPLPPIVLLVAAALVAVVLTPVALRLLPVTRPAALALAALVVAPAVLAAPIGDLLDGVYLAGFGLRATDVAQTFAQRWWSGAFFGAVGLAGVAVAATLWGVVYRLDAVGRRRPVPPAPLLAVGGLVYLAALLAMCAGEAGNQAGAGAGRLPGGWGGITPTWACWSPTGTGPVPFAGRALPPTTAAIVWLGGADGRFALWSPDTGGATVSDQVQLRVRDTAGPCS